MPPSVALEGIGDSNGKNWLLPLKILCTSVRLVPAKNVAVKSDGSWVTNPCRHERSINMSTALGMFPKDLFVPPPEGNTDKQFSEAKFKTSAIWSTVRGLASIDGSIPSTFKLEVRSRNAE
jgi:hypothetical protein